MDIVGKIIEVCPVQEGTSRSGNPWRKRIYVLETQETYPKKVAFTVFGLDRVDQYKNVQAGQVMRVSFDIDSREYNGRWYTDINCWRMEPADANGAQPQAQAPRQQGAAPAADAGAVPPPPAVAPAGPSDDLPF